MAIHFLFLIVPAFWAYFCRSGKKLQLRSQFIDYIAIRQYFTTLFVLYFQWFLFYLILHHFLQIYIRVKFCTRLIFNWRLQFELRVLSAFSCPILDASSCSFRNGRIIVDIFWWCGEVRSGFGLEERVEMVFWLILCLKLYWWSHLYI